MRHSTNIIDFDHQQVVMDQYLLFKLILIILFIVLQCINNPKYVNTTSIIVANRKDIRKLDQLSFKSNSNKLIYNQTILKNQLEDVIAIDYDYNENLLFYTDRGLESIKSINLSNFQENTIVNNGIESPESIACDWITKKLYWIDSDINNLVVSTYDGSYRNVLVWTNMDNPRSLVLVPSERFMFWSDWGHTPKIERISMDGNQSTRKTIINKDIQWPNALTIDYNENRLYYADAKYGYISSCDFDGNSIRKIISSITNIFAISFHENTIYWTEMSNNINHNQQQLTHNNNNPSYRNGINYYDIENAVIGSPALNPPGELSPLGITVFNASRQPISNNTCESNRCSHLCLLSSVQQSGYSCSCPTGIVLKSDLLTCNDGAQEFLLLARRFDIRIISLDTEDYTPVVLLKTNIKNTITLDYDPIESKVYFADDELRTIRWSFMNGSQQETIISTEVMHIDGLAVDWIARNIYWTDLAIDRIEVAKLDGSFRKVLVDENIDQPRAIVIHPFEGFMFWSDWGTIPKIERASLDGSDRIVLVNTSLNWPNGLAIDFELSKLYWCDAKLKTIEMISFDGSNRNRIALIERSHMFGFSILNEWIYWTDWTLRTIERVHKMTGQNHMIIVENLPDLMGLKAVGSLQQFERFDDNPCSASNNGGCEQFCFNQPRNAQNYVCGCSDGYQLDMENGHKCLKSESYLWLFRNNNTLKISLKSKTKVVMDMMTFDGAQSFDLDDKFIYWSNNHMIYRSLIQNPKAEILIEQGLGSLINIALDWISQNLYWIDVYNHRLEVSKSNGSYRRILYYDRSRQPNSVTLDPMMAQIFFSDWSNNGRIFTCLMDGNRRRSIIDSIGKAYGLTLDYSMKKLYWISMDRIMSSYYNGTDRIIHHSISSMITPISIAIDDDYIYYLNGKSIEFINKSTDSEFNSPKIWMTIGEEQSSFGKQLKLYDKSIRKNWNICMNYANNECEQLCFIRMKNGQKFNRPQQQESNCNCETHYQLDLQDFKKCLPPEKFLLFSSKHSISRFLFDSKITPSFGINDFQDVILPIHNIKNAKKLAYDPLDHMVYWIDGKSVKRTNMNGLSAVESFAHSHHSNHQHYYDMVLDPYARILFWSCNLTNTINATRISGNGKPIMIGSVHNSRQDSHDSNDEMDQPRLLAYHYYTNALYWTNDNPKKLQINRIIFGKLLRKSSIIDQLKFNIISMTIDQELNLLIWSQAYTNRIEFSDLQGYSRQVLYDEDNLHPFSLATFDGYLFWLDRNSIQKIPLDLNNGKNKQIIISKNYTLTDIISIVNMSKYSSDLYCNRENGGCSHFCFMNHTGNSDDGDRFDCSCPQGLMLADNNENSSGQTMSRDCVKIIDCKSDEFQCKSGKCIPASLRCNGIVNCLDSSDEMNCPICLTNQTICYDGNDVFCVGQEKLCDGHFDCSNGMDELCCNNHIEFRCHNGNCINVQQVCNGQSDCLNGEDEYDCTERQLTFNNVSIVDGQKFSYSFIVLIIIFAVIVFIYLYYQCYRKLNNGANNLNDNKFNNQSNVQNPVHEGVNDVLMMSERWSNVPNGNQKINVDIQNNRNPYKKYQLNSIVNSNGVTKIDCNTLTTTTTTISGLDPVMMHGSSKINPVSPSIIDVPSSKVDASIMAESLLERNVTGASSTSSSYAGQQQVPTKININPPPPPSPATQRSQCSTLSSSLFIPRSSRGRNGMFKNGGGSKNRKKTSKNKNKWKSNRGGPPPTPCSTDVYEDLEPLSATIKYVYYDNDQNDFDDQNDDYKPPPPTPRYFSDPSCPPSPLLERHNTNNYSIHTNPYPPPPSPVQDYE